MVRKTPPGPHHLPVSQQQHRHVIIGRRLGDCSDECMMIILWDPPGGSWVFYTHGSPHTAARFTDADVRATAEHILRRTP
ncbi:MAG: hypothetical protein ACRDUV_15620 [Pseudonocardiaceae bacterium]